MGREVYFEGCLAVLFLERQHFQESSPHVTHSGNLASMTLFDLRGVHGFVRAMATTNHHLSNTQPRQESFDASYTPYVSPPDLFLALHERQRVRDAGRDHHDRVQQQQ